MRELSDFFEGSIKRVGFFGLGKSNLALLQTLSLSGVEITLRVDTENMPKIPLGIGFSRIFFGRNACRDIDEELIFFSPSVRRDRPALLRASERGVIFSSDCELFFRAVEQRGKRVLAISGSDGKSSVTAMTGEILRSGGKGVGVIGNIGEPMLRAFESSDLFVSELSSFQLFYLKTRIFRAALTNITPNHLNWHKDFDEYKETKLSLISMADEGVVSFDDGELSDCFAKREIFGACKRGEYKELKSRVRAEVYVTSDENFIYRNGERLLPISRVKRREAHNLSNLMSAIALCEGLCESKDILRVAEDFSGLSHRAELIGSLHGVDFIDSSIDTTPERTRTTLSSLGRRVVIILGGRGKGVDYSVLMPELKKHARLAVLTGEDSEKIATAIGGEVDIRICEDFGEAVTCAISEATAGEGVLLSPAATSYDVFKNYEERAERFKSIVREYCKKEKKSH